MYEYYGVLLMPWARIMDPNSIAVDCYMSIVISKFQSLLSKFTYEFNVSLPVNVKGLNLISPHIDKKEHKLTIAKKVEELSTDSGLD